MEPVGCILLKDIEGIKLAKSTMKKIMSGFSSSSPANVLRGELLVPFKTEEYHYNYQLHRDHSILVFSSEEHIAPLNYHEFQLLEGIKKLADRYSAFTSDKLEWGHNLEPGYSVFVTLPGPNLSVAPFSRATVHYKGKIGNDSGTQFGVEIMEEKYRTGQFGTTDGTFQGHRYFNCADGCGLFVSLHLLSQTPVTVCDPHPTHRTSHSINQASDPVGGKKSYANVLSSGKGNGSSTQSSQSRKAEESSVDRSSKIRQSMRVRFYDKKNTEHQGIVKWTGRAPPGKPFNGIILGIITDEPIFKSDFEDSIRGMDMNVPEAPARRALFLPEVLVDPITEGMNVESIAKELKVSKMELMKEQKEVLEEVSKVKVEQSVVKAARTADVNMDDINQQKEAMEQFERKKKKRDEDNSECGHDPNEDNTTVPCINDQQATYKKYSEQAKLRNNAESALTRKPMHTYEAVGAHSPASHHKNVPLNPDRPPHYENTGVNAHRGLSQQGTPSAVADQQAYHDQLHHQYNLRSRNQRIPADYEQQEVRAQELQHHGQEGYSNVSPSVTRARENPSHIPQQDPSVPRAQGDQDLHPPNDFRTQMEHHGNSNSPNLRGDQIVASTGSGPPMNLGRGSLIQIDSHDADKPLRYGTIRWIGLLQGVQGEIAGIELDEPMEGCTDGTFQQTGQKFFDCPDGRGIYYPLKGLVPDSRYAPEISADGNPLRDVIEEESDSHEVNIDKYVGEGRGIQGHQNSCYLDATVFGLFALTTEFDDMFLQNYSMSDVGKILWRNIVNPLRKHGVVKYESVMKLREQLEQLGKMKGITQDEKDPEEFLNMMFKHTLQISPFISIRRPFGVEEEFFVQLFLEIDESLKMPSISELLHKMFQEQNISFTKIPSKLLVQVPRFGKKFKTFQKIIPTKSMNVARIVDDDEHKLPDCFICEKPATMTCEECKKDLNFPSDSAGLCKDCCDKLHSHSLRKNGHEPQFSQEMNNLLSLSELELLSVICIETSHYVCFTRKENRWIFFDSMANRVYDQYNIPKVVDCTDMLNEWVYPQDQDMRRLLETPPRELPEYVRRFTQDIYMCVYIQPDLGMYGH